MRSLFSLTCLSRQLKIVSRKTPFWRGDVVVKTFDGLVEYPSYNLWSPFVVSKANTLENSVLTSLPYQGRIQNLFKKGEGGPLGPFVTSVGGGVHAKSLPKNHEHDMLTIINFTSTTKSACHNGRVNFTCKKGCVASPPSTLIILWR